MRHRRGECAVEGVFGAIARKEGSDLGYDTVAASGNHANTLRWIDSGGPVNEDDLIFMDAGVEVGSSYTTDITHILPVNGRFTEVQARVYQAVLDACKAALTQANELGTRFCDVHDAVMLIIATRLREWGLLPVSIEESFSPVDQQHRRWMPHGMSHHLGLDVHDYVQARREMYQDTLSEPGMTFTIEPGLYFRADDEATPAEYHDIGTRIGDDVVVSEDGSITRISGNIPCMTNDVEAWTARTQGC